MGNIVIPIGGSGARCMEAFTFLCACGLGPVEQAADDDRQRDDRAGEYYTFFIDQDKSNGNLDSTKKLLNQYMKCRAAIKPESANSLFGTNISMPADDNDQVWQPFSQDTLREFVQYDSADFDDEDKDLLGLLVSKEHLDMDLKDGFIGVPMIGTYGMLHIPEDEAPFIKIENLLSQPGGRMFVFASIFGGTGAAGFPTIGNYFREKYSSDFDPSSSLGGALLLPYFKLDDSKAEDSKKYAALYKKFIPNSVVALKYYANTENWGHDGAIEGIPYSWIFTIGDPVPEHTATTWARGDRPQKNRAHYVEMISALSACCFFEAPQEDVDTLENNNRRLKQGYVVRENKDCVLWADIPCNSAKFKTGLTKMLIFSLFFTDSLAPTIKKEPGAYKRDGWYRQHFKGKPFTSDENMALIAVFEEFCSKLLEWIEEMQEGEQCFLRLYKFHKNSEGKRPFPKYISFKMYANDDTKTLDQEYKLPAIYKDIKNTISSTEKEVAPHGAGEVGRLCYLVYQAVSQYVDHEMKIDT